MIGRPFLRLVDISQVPKYKFSIRLLGGRKLVISLPVCGFLSIL